MATRLAEKPIAGLIADWQRAKAAASNAQERERALRARIAELLVPNPVEGVNTVTLADGRKVKVDQRYNYTFDKDTVDATLDELLEFGVDTGALVRWSPDLNLTAYRALNKDALVILSRTLTRKPGTASLTVIDAPEKADARPAPGVRGKGSKKHH